MKFLLVILKQVEDGPGTMLQQLKLGYKIGDRICSSPPSMLYWGLEAEDTKAGAVCEESDEFPILSTSCFEHVAFEVKGIWAKFS